MSAIVVFAPWETDTPNGLPRVEEESNLFPPLLPTLSDLITQLPRVITLMLPRLNGTTLRFRKRSTSIKAFVGSDGVARGDGSRGLPMATGTGARRGVSA